MAKVLITSHDVETGEVIEREVTTEEREFLDLMAAETAERDAAKAAAQAEKEAILAQLGISEEQLRIALG